MNALQVGQTLHLAGGKEQPATFADIDFTAAHIEGHLDLSSATLSGLLTMRRAQVDRDLLMRASDDGQPCEVHSNVRQRRRAWSATTLAPSFSALEADVAAQLAPVRRIERSQLRANWHRKAVCLNHRLNIDAAVGARSS